MPNLVNVNVAKPQVTLPPGSRLGLPGAVIFVVGLALIYIALRGWDKKYGLFGGALAGKATNVGTGGDTGSLPGLPGNQPIPSGDNGPGNFGGGSSGSGGGSGGGF